VRKKGRQRLTREHRKSGRTLVSIGSDGIAERKMRFVRLEVWMKDCERSEGGINM
jgi:hypothetical protein